MPKKKEKLLHVQKRKKFLIIQWQKHENEIFEPTKNTSFIFKVLRVAVLLQQIVCLFVAGTLERVYHKWYHTSKEHYHKFKLTLNHCYLINRQATISDLFQTYFRPL